MHSISDVRHKEVHTAKLYIDEITGYDQCGFRRNRSTTNKVACIGQLLDRKLRDSTSAEEWCLLGCYDVWLL
jgi:hypothetical protein